MPKVLVRRALHRQRILECGFRLGILAVCLAAFAFGSWKLVVWTRSVDESPASVESEDNLPASVSINPEKLRPVYRYSVVPGGVETPEELAQAIHKDPVVADHYRDFKLQRASLVTVEKPQLVHVSYRIKDKVYWTRNKLRLSPGERLISDGQELARTRCGTQVSETLREPTLELEPPLEDLDTPEPFVLPLMVASQITAPAKIPDPPAIPDISPRV